MIPIIADGKTEQENYTVLPNCVSVMTLQTCFKSFKGYLEIQISKKGKETLKSTFDVISREYFLKKTSLRETFVSGSLFHVL